MVAGGCPEQKHYPIRNNSSNQTHSLLVVNLSKLYTGCFITPRCFQNSMLSQVHKQFRNKIHLELIMSY